jgi:hypothetical protein
MESVPELDGARRTAAPTYFPRSQVKWIVAVSLLVFTRRKWSDRNKRLELLLFPGYLFCQFEWSMRLGAAYAQTSRGTVTGTVLDSSGATRGVDMADTGDKIAGPTS